MARFLFAFILFLGMPRPRAWADEVPSGPLTLLQAWHLALRQNADLRVAEAQTAAALAQLRAVREYPNPVAGYSVAKINTDGRSNAMAAGSGLWNRSYDSIVSLSQLVELGKRGVRRDSAAAAVRSAEALREDTRRLFWQSTGQLYFAALESLAEVRVLGQSAESLRKEAQIGAARLQAGDLAAADEAQLEIAATQLELAAASARTSARQAILALESLLGYPNPRGDTGLADTFESAGTRQNLTGSEPVESRPDLRSAESVLEKSEADLTLQRRAVVPDLTLSVQYEHQPPDQPNTVGVGFTFPLPVWNRNRGNILAALAARDEAQAQLDKVRTEAAADVARARAAYVETRARAEAYTHDLQPKSASVIQTIEYAYEKGGTSLVELLTAERNDNDVRLAAVRAQADAADAAWALAAALNRIEPASADAPRR